MLITLTCAYAWWQELSPPYGGWRFSEERPSSPIISASNGTTRGCSRISLITGWNFTSPSTLSIMYRPRIFPGLTTKDLYLKRDCWLAYCCSFAEICITFPEPSIRGSFRGLALILPRAASVCFRTSSNCPLTLEFPMLLLLKSLAV